MARPSSSAAPSNPFERAVFEIGQRLGHALLAGVQSRAGAAHHAAPVAHTAPRAAAAPGKRGPGRPKASGSSTSCAVPDCGRPGVAKGLCATHYRKAHRLGYNEPFTAAQFTELSADGRKTRHLKAA